ncbi:hypothetical protein [Streptomyces sp. NPDC090025]|uniref:hypothetical protein n=1 Tax=Streptomyces sp. NPDC090025 TaxID=3365922 RepID=UPI003834A1A4
MFTAAVGLSVCAGSAAYATTRHDVPAPRALDAQASDSMPNAVEDFGYPHADQILKDRGIKLIRGDGRLLLTECTDNWNIQVKSNSPDVGSNFRFCFAASGNSGFLSLELKDVFIIQTDGNAVRAKMANDSGTTTVDVPKDDYKPVGEGDLPGGGQKATLVELRVTG